VKFSKVTSVNTVNFLLISLANAVPLLFFLVKVTSLHSSLSDSFQIVRIDFVCCFCCIKYHQGNMNYHYYYCYSNFDVLEIIWIRIRCFFMLNDFVILLYDLMKCFYVNSVWLFEFIILLGLGLFLDLTKVTKFWFNYNIIIISVHLQTVMLDWDTRSGLLLLMHLMSRC
jgi:hypothetical protein